MLVWRWLARRTAIAALFMAVFAATAGAQGLTGPGSDDAGAKGSFESPIDTLVRWDRGFGIGFGCNGPVFDLEPLGDGRLLVVGSYTLCGNASVVHASAWNPAAGRFERLSILGDISGVGARAAVVTDTRIFVGGEFFQAGGQPAANIAVLDRTTSAWSALGLPGAEGALGRVNALAFAGDTLYVGGEFLVAGGVAATRVAAYSLSTGTWSTLGAGVDGTVHALAVVDGVLYVGGEFASAGGGVAARLARWDIASQSWLATAGADGPVYSLAAGLDGLYAGGAFSSIGGIAARRIARRDGAGNWSPLGDGIGGATGPGGGDVRAVLPLTDGVLAGGEFALAGGTVAVNRVAQFAQSAGVWRSLGNGASNGTTGPVLALAALGGDAFVGGQFAQAGGAVANTIARFSLGGRTWSVLGSDLSNGIDGEVRVLAGNAADVFAAGAFSVAGGAAAPFIARYRPAQRVWSALGAPGTGTSNIVQALAFEGNSLYVGGTFQQAGGLASPGVARFDVLAQTWAPLAGGVAGVVNALLARSDGVIAAGTITAAGGAPVRNLARYDSGAQAWQPLGAGAGGVDGVVFSLAGIGNLVVVGGQFAEAGGIPAANIATFDLAGGQWSTLAGGVDGIVRALAADNDHVYVGGSFSSAGGLSVANLARYHRASGTWSAVPGVGAAGVNGAVNSLVLAGGTLWVGGSFTRVGASAALRNRITRIDLSSGVAAPVGSENFNGFDGQVNAVLPVGTDLYAGGTFGQALAQLGDVRSLRIGRYDVRRQVTTTVVPSTVASVRVNNTVQLSATVAASGFPPVPGRVDILDSFGPIPGCGNLELIGGTDVRTATCNTNQLVVGTRVINARYQGDAANFLGTSLAEVLDVEPPDFRFAPANLPGGTFGAPGYLAGPIVVETSGATGVVAPALLVVVDTLQLPPGLVATQQAGGLVISGTPTQAGTFSFAVRATDSSSAAVGGPFSGDREYSIVVAKATQTITPIARVDAAPLDNGVALADGDFAVQASATSGLPVVIDSTTPTVCQVGAPGFMLRPLQVGTCTLRARQAGNANFDPAPEVLRTFQVKATPVVFIDSAPNPSLWPLGQTQHDPVVLTATVEGSEPSGTVRFLRGMNTIAGCNAQPMSTVGNVGTATCSTTGLQRGPNTLAAFYDGDVRNVAESSNAITHQLNVGTAVGIATISPIPCVVGQGCTVAVAVAAASGTPTGSVQVASSTGGSCTVTLAGGGGSCALTATASGSGTVAATYLGSPPWLASPAANQSHPFVATVDELFTNGFEHSP